ncbi:MAG: TIGR02996 domain-containing protein [Gemmataceae bacterium]
MSDPQGEQLLRAIRENPCDVSLVLIYADYLEEQEQALAANAIRIRKRVGKSVYQWGVPGHGEDYREGQGYGFARAGTGMSSSGTDWVHAASSAPYHDLLVEVLVRSYKEWSNGSWLWTTKRQYTGSGVGFEHTDEGPEGLEHRAGF